MPGDDHGPEPEFNDETEPVTLSILADSIAGSAADADEALDMCSDLATAENLDPDQYLDLVGMVESATGWELPEDGGRF